MTAADNDFILLMRSHLVESSDKNLYSLCSEINARCPKYFFSENITQFV